MDEHVRRRHIDVVSTFIFIRKDKSNPFFFGVLSNEIKNYEGGSVDR